VAVAAREKRLPRGSNATHRRLLDKKTTKP
jgi:hypothetical protein